MVRDAFKWEAYFQNGEWDVWPECDDVGREKFVDKKCRKRFIFEMKTLRFAASSKSFGNCLTETSPLYFEYRENENNSIAYRMSKFTEYICVVHVGLLCRLNLSHFHLLVLAFYSDFILIMGVYGIKSIGQNKNPLQRKIWHLLICLDFEKVTRSIKFQHHVIKIIILDQCFLKRVAVILAVMWRKSMGSRWCFSCYLPTLFIIRSSRKTYLLSRSKEATLSLYPTIDYNLFQSNFQIDPRLSSKTFINMNL